MSEDFNPEQELFLRDFMQMAEENNLAAQNSKLEKELVAALQNLGDMHALSVELLSMLKAAMVRIEAFDRQPGDADLIAEMRALIQKAEGQCQKI